MKIIGIDIGTTTISGVVLENKVEGQITTKAEEKLEIVEAKTIENGCFIPTEHEWERIQDAEQIVKKAQNLTDYFLISGCRENRTYRADAWNCVH